MPAIQSQCPDIHGQFCCTLKENLSDARFNHAGFAKDGSGCILAEDGKEVCFERSEASNRVDDLGVGHWVEFELQYGFERPCAVNVKRLHRDADICHRIGLAYKENP